MTNMVAVRLQGKLAVRRFTKVGDLRKFMADEKLSAKFSEDKEDRRFLVDSKNEKAWQLFEFDDDKHYGVGFEKRNPRAQPAYFDDWEDLHVKGRK